MRLITLTIVMHLYYDLILSACNAFPIEVQIIFLIIYSTSSKRRTIYLFSSLVFIIHSGPMNNNNKEEESLVRLTYWFFCLFWLELYCIYVSKKNILNNIERHILYILYIVIQFQNIIVFWYNRNIIITFILMYSTCEGVSIIKRRVHRMIKNYAYLTRSSS